jgi:hypothetical protein
MITWALVLAAAMFLLTMHVFLRPEVDKAKQATPHAATYGP